MKFDTNELPVGYGLSCIENYVMLLLKEYNKEWEYIFYKSYLSFFEIFDEFYIKKKQYSYFKKIPRLQEVGVELGKFNIRDIIKKNIKELFQQASIAAICVTPEYIEEKYKTRLWRDDHFILLQNYNKDLYAYINDNPQDEGYLSLEELNKIFTGEAILFEMKNNSFTDEQKKKMVQYFYESVVNAEDNDDKTIFNGNIEIDMIRDMLGVLRVVVKRTAAFCNKYFNVDFLDEYYSSLDEYFAKLEYMRLRKRYSLEGLHEIVNNIYIKDNSIKKILTERLANIYENDRK